MKTPFTIINFKPSADCDFKEVNWVKNNTIKRMFLVLLNNLITLDQIMEQSEDNAVFYVDDLRYAMLIYKTGQKERLGRFKAIKSNKSSSEYILDYVNGDYYIWA